MPKNIFSKMLAGDDEPALPINPIQLYQNLPYKDGYGYLRGIQEEVLTVWHEIRQQRDVLCKMNTGSGKTLTSLLMLYSKLIEKKEPCVYLCPDNQLVEQTIRMAALYGIPVCEFQHPSEFPGDFINSKKILVCNFFKLFNGKSIFNREKIKIGALVIDDAHKCLDIARKQASFNISRDHPISKSLFKLFERSLKHQLIGTFVGLEQGDPTMVMKIPYWTWIENNEKIVRIITSYIKDEMENEEGLQFAWEFMSNDLLSYNCYIGGARVEISPIHTPFHLVPSFNEASHRYILSATFEDDFDLIRDLGISKASILKPIIPKDRKDVGKRLMLAPGRLDHSLADKEIVKFIAKYPKQNLNVVVLVPSDERAKPWKDAGATIVNKDNIQEEIAKLKNKKNNFMVFVNRYDGMDLHGDMCRILVVDGLPRYKSLEESYAESRIDELNAGSKAQIIEQGLGRAVRSGADYCAVYLMGPDLLKFLAYNKHMENFTPVTRAQMNLGLKLMDDLMPGKNPLKALDEIADLCLTENRDWLRVHSQRISQILQDEMTDSKLLKIELADFERLALEEFRKRNYQKATRLIQEKILDNKQLSAKLKAWYYQFAGHMSYLGNPVTANGLQGKAWLFSSNMFHPENEHGYNKISKKSDAQTSIVIKNLAEFERPSDIKGYVHSLQKVLQYGKEFDSKVFERALRDVGDFLGFTTQMPESSTGEGPDVLWCMSDGYYLILEAKSEKDKGDIFKADIEQIQQSEIWFRKRYGQSAKYTGVTLQISRKKDREAQTEKQHQVIDKEHLELFCTNLEKFADSLQDSNPSGYSEDQISKLLISFKFTPSLFRDTYIKPIK